jgi:hypothetical protein
MAALSLTFRYSFLIRVFFPLSYCFLISYVSFSSHLSPYPSNETLVEGGFRSLKGTNGFHVRIVVVPLSAFPLPP